MEAANLIEQPQSEADIALAKQIRLVEKQYGSIADFFEQLHPEEQETKEDRELEKLGCALREIAKRGSKIGAHQ